MSIILKLRHLAVRGVVCTKSGEKPWVQHSIVSLTIALIFILFQTFECRDVYGAEQIKGHDPKYNQSSAGMNHLILGIDQLENNEYYAARQNFLFIINLKADAPAMGGMRLKPLAYLNLGVVDSLEGNPTAAIKNFQTAIELNPDYAEAYFNIGAVQYKIGALKKAEEAFLKAIELEPDYGRAHYSLGFVYFDQKKYDLAKVHAEKAAESGVPYKTLKERLAKVNR